MESLGTRLHKTWPCSQAFHQGPDPSPVESLGTRLHKTWPCSQAFHQGPDPSPVERKPVNKATQDLASLSLFRPPAVTVGFESVFYSVDEGTATVALTVRVQEGQLGRSVTIGLDTLNGTAVGMVECSPSNWNLPPTPPPPPNFLQCTREGPANLNLSKLIFSSSPIILTTAPSDYTAITDRLLLFDETTRTQTIVIAIVNDDKVEVNETFTAELSLISADAAQRLTIDPDKAIITIISDDSESQG